jgi:hypothetical protein
MRRAGVPPIGRSRTGDVGRHGGDTGGLAQPDTAHHGGATAAGRTGLAIGTDRSIQLRNFRS